MKERNGIIKLVNDVVVWEIKDQKQINIAVNSIQEIEEFTTDNGPFFDDRFLRVKTSDSQYEISIYTQGVESLLIDLGNYLERNLTIGLANSTEFKTRVIYSVEN